MARGVRPAACEVALPIPVDRTYTYAVPLNLADRILPGSRVLVELRNRKVIGLVMSLDGEKREGLKPVLLAPDQEPLVSPGMLELGRWMARYYLAPIGLALKAVLPGALWGSSKLTVTLVDPTRTPGGAGRQVVELLERKGGAIGSRSLEQKLGRRAWPTVQRLAAGGVVRIDTAMPRTGVRRKMVRHIRLTRSIQSLMELEEVFRRARRQREAYEILDAMGGEAEVTELQKNHGLSRAVLNGLVERGVATMESRERYRDPFSNLAESTPHEPTRRQLEAIAEIETLEPAGALLLFGVTGSGKTLVYLEALRREVGSGGGAIVLVPEIALTRQTIARVRGVFGDSVAVLHSGMSDGERLDAWRALASGAKRVAVGARSAVFAPVQELRAIVLDEEHDHSYKNGEAPRYHAREVAFKRAAIEGARLILGSATPALETWALRDRIKVVTLPARATDAGLPHVRVLDLKKEANVPESGPVPWSVELDRAVREKLEREQQVILLLNRRGWAHYLQCRSCGGVVTCDNCSIALTVHRLPDLLRCHYCGFSRPAPPGCETCGGEQQETRGVGTQSLERWIGERFPTAAIARMDADTTGTKWSHRRILDAFGKGEIDILFGTQMISKGLDFPNVTLVGVIDADTSLHLPDFRAAERTFQLIAQVAGRSGRGPEAGQVIVQTRMPDHYALVHAANHDFEGFAARELAERESPPYPPYVSLVNALVSGQSETAVAAAAAGLAEWVGGLIERKVPGEVDLIGPAPAPLARVKGRWRWHFLLRARDRKLLGRVARYVAGHAGSVTGRNARVVLDRDPTSLL